MAVFIVTMIRGLGRVLLASCLTLGSNSALAKSSAATEDTSRSCAVRCWFADPKGPVPVLEKISEKNGTVVESFSDGLEVVSHLQDRIETRTSDHFYSKSSSFTEDPRATDNYVCCVIIQAWAKYGKYSSSSQSRLRQYSEYYLAVNRPEQAERWAHDYLDIQRSLPFGGMPLARAESILGDVDLKLGKTKEAKELLQSAADFYKKSCDRTYYGKVANNLGLALLASNETNEAIAQFKISRKLAKNVSPLLYEEATTNYRSALANQENHGQ